MGFHPARAEVGTEGHATYCHVASVRRAPYSLQALFADFPAGPLVPAGRSRGRVSVEADRTLALRPGHGAPDAEKAPGPSLARGEDPGAALDQRRPSAVTAAVPPVKPPQPEDRRRGTLPGARRREGPRARSSDTGAPRVDWTPGGTSQNDEGPRRVRAGAEVVRSAESHGGRLSRG